MKTYMVLFLLVVFSICQSAYASPQPPKKGFNYKAHKQMNQKANRWGVKRMKSAKFDMVNLKCTGKQSRKYARSQKS